jgi:hypothetical protein
MSVRFEAALAALAMQWTKTGSSQVNLAITLNQPPSPPLSASGFLFSVTTPPGNALGDNNNNLFAFVSSSDPPTQMPWQFNLTTTSPVYATAAMANNAYSNTIAPAAGNFGATPYVLGYSVGPAVQTGSPPVTTYPNICATAMLGSNWGNPPDPNNPFAIQYFAPSLDVKAVTPNVIQFAYSFPTGYNPSVSAWIGVWQGNSPTLYNITNAPVGFAAITQYIAAYTQNVPVATLSPGTPYTAGLFTSGFAKSPGSLVTTALAATVSFITL